MPAVGLAHSLEKSSEGMGRQGKLGQQKGEKKKWILGQK
jgi:hypothetical protein